MNKLWFKSLLVAVFVIQCGSVQAGWFDNKKKSSEEIKKETAVVVQKVKETLPLKAAVALQPSTPEKSAVVQEVKSLSPAKQASVAPATAPAEKSTNQEPVRFFDMGPNGARSDQEISAEELKKAQASVRLGEEETKKMKEEVEKMQEGIKAAQDARQAAQVIRTVVKPEVIPVVPKLPALPNVQKVTPTSAVKPQSFKPVNTAAVTSGYKK